MKLTKYRFRMCIFMALLLFIYVNKETPRPENEEAKDSLMLLVVLNSCCSLKVERLSSGISVTTTFGM